MLGLKQRLGCVPQLGSLTKIFQGYRCLRPALWYPWYELPSLAILAAANYSQ